MNDKAIVIATKVDIKYMVVRLQWDHQTKSKC